MSCFYRYKRKDLGTIKCQDSERSAHISYFQEVSARALLAPTPVHHLQKVAEIFAAQMGLTSRPDTAPYDTVL